MKSASIAISLPVVLIASMALACIVPFAAYGEQGGAEVALIVQLKGKALVERGPESAFEAFIKSPIQLRDVIETMKKSRAKMLFTDESVMTLGPRSRASVKKFVKGMEGAPGTTVFNLASGKMRTVVGKTRFEVHTPTVVAAARGTVIEFTVAVVDGKTLTVVTCLEGAVELTSTDPSVTGTLKLEAGNTITVYEGEDPSLIDPVPTSEYAGLTGEARVVTAIETDTIDSIHTPAVVITPPVETIGMGATPVIVDVAFPVPDKPRPD